MSEELKPCPFVHEVVRGVSVEIDDEEWDCACVRCGDCAAMGPVLMLDEYSDHPTASDAAIAAWNKRATPNNDLPTGNDGGRG